MHLNPNIVFIGVDKNAKGGIASVLQEYAKIFPEAKFVATSVEGNKLIKVFTLLKSLIIVLKLILLSKNTVFHIHGASYVSFKRKYIFYKLIKFFHGKIIYHIHGGEFELFFKNSSDNTKNKIKNFIEGADCIICLSEFWKSFFTSNFQLKRIEIVRNIVPYGKVKSNKNWNDVVFLFLGQITEGKGIWLLIEAAFELKNMGKKFRILIGGSGETQKLLQLIDEYNLTEDVSYVGWISGDKKQKLFLEATVFILPSFNEGVPISILEAMSYNLPVVATRVGGIPDLMNEKNGILIEPRNIDELLGAMIFVCDNSDKLADLGSNNSEFVNEHYPDNVKQTLSRIYAEIITNESR